MAYSAFALLSLLVHIIINHNELFKSGAKNSTKYLKNYRLFLYGVTSYYITDSLWGILYETKQLPAIYIDTIIYFIAMAVTVFLWTRYVIEFLEKDNIYTRMLSIFGWGYLFSDGLALLINFFYPIKFYFDSDGIYHACITRHIGLYIQIFMFFITAVYVFVFSRKEEGRVKLRYMTVGSFGLAMTLFVIAQEFFPLQPFYSIGYLLGTCLIHTFVLEAEKEEYRDELEIYVTREKLQKMELGSTRKLVYIDSLTGVKNKRAFTEAQKEVDEAVNCGLISEFGLIVFDLNGLKAINDKYGHDAGDKYIQDSSQLICNYFKHSPVYRIGGDEFVAFLRGEDYKKRKELLKAFEKRMEENLYENNIVIASGLDNYKTNKNDTFSLVFERADKKMYKRKQQLKEMKLK